MPNQQPLDLMFQALADPTRRDMLDRLAQGPASVSGLAAPYAMSLPAVVQHLKLLETSGLVRSVKTGRVRICHIERDGLERAEAWLAARRRLWDRRLDSLGGYLAEGR